jgi:dTDP-4-dehydrorhamnose reductase
VTGIAGVAGYAALAYFQRKFGERVAGIRQQDNVKLSGPGIYACDAEDRDALAELFRRHRFAAVLNCAGNCALKKCEFDPAMAERINVDGVSNLLDVIDDQPRPVRLVHLSIDLVYSGRFGGGHDEGRPTDPVTVYGRTMVAGEQIIARRKPDAAILRISLPMGVSFNGHAGAIDWIQSRFKKHRPATLYFDEIRTPTYVDCLNRACDAVLASDLCGLYHAGGPRRLSLFQIAQIVNRVGGYDPRLLIGCYRRDAGPMPPRAGNVSIDSSRLADALGCEPFDPWPLADEFVPTDPLWHYDRGGQAGSPQLLARMLYRNPALR